MADLSFDDLIPSGGGSKSNSLDTRSRDLAIRTVLGEAANQGDDGMAGVAHVMQNRVRAGRYGGDSLPAVIAKPYAFEPWNTQAGRDKMFSYAPESPEYQKAAAIVDQVFGGQLPDNTNGATHFVSPSVQGALGRSQPRWASGEPLARIGAHNFYAPEGRVGAPAKVESAPLSAPLSAPQETKQALSFDDLIPQAKPNPVDARFPEEQQNPELAGQLQNAGPALAGDKGALDAAARGAAQGATFNFYDELRGLAEASGLDPKDPASLKAILSGGYKYLTGDKEAVERYNAATKRERGETQKAEALHPTASLAGGLAGAIAVPVGGMASAATTGARVARGLKLGAAGGALAGVGAGENEQQRISSGLTGAATGAALGGAVGGVLGRRGMPQEGRVQAADIFSSAKPHYREFKDVSSKVEIPAETKTAFADRLRGALDNVNLTDEMAGAPAKSALKLLEGDNTISLYDLQRVKRFAARGFNSAEKDVRDGAAAISKEITKIINEVSPGAGKALKAGDDIHSTAIGVRELDRKFDIAGLRTGRAGYGGNYVNNMRQVISPIVERAINDKKTPFKPNEITALREFVEGDKATNLARQVGALSPAKGGMQSLGGIATLGASAAVGIVGNKIAAKMTTKQAARLRDLVAKRSPAYAAAVKKSAERYEKAMEEFANGPSSGRLAKLIGASRTLSGGLNKDGIQITSGDLLKLLQSPGAGRADEDEVDGKVAE